MRMHIDRDRFEACPQYNEWIDQRFAEQIGRLNILGFEPRPSDVLFQLSPDTYQAAFADFQREWEEELKEEVFGAFPFPISHYFYRFETGYENDLQRLHLLRDTWESIVDVLHAIAVSECRHRRLPLAEPLKFSDLLTDSVAQRLLNIERILQYASGRGISLMVAHIVPLSTLETMRDLNRSRNGFSHSAAQSEMQARAWISECYADVLDVMDDIRGLADVEILRYINQPDSSTLRCELFRSHSLTRTIKLLPLTPLQSTAAQPYCRPGQVLLSSDTDLFSLLPLVNFKEDASGQFTRLCLFRRTHGDAPHRQIEYEIVGEAARVNTDRVLVQVDINELRALFGLAPE